MKQMLVLAVLACIVSVSCVSGDKPNASEAKILDDVSKYTTIQWQDTVVNFGTVDMGTQVKVAFHFKNTGTQPLFLANVKAGCGCTVPDYTKGAIAPGGEGEVTGSFNSNMAHVGEVRKNIHVTTNTVNGSSHTLIFTGTIKDVVQK